MASDLSNEEFYDDAHRTFSRRFDGDKRTSLKPYIRECVEALRVAEVLRYHKESTNMGTVIGTNTKLFEDEWFDQYIQKVMTIGWMMDIAGTEYMLELTQPTNPEYATSVSTERYKLSTDSWSIAFTLVQQNTWAASNVGLPILKYMNKYVLVGKFDPQGNLNDLTNCMAMFRLVRNDYRGQL